MLKRAEEDDEDVIELESIVTALEHLPSRDRTDRGERRGASAGEPGQPATARRTSGRALGAFRTALEAALDAVQRRVGDPHSFDAARACPRRQPYRLAYWRVAAEEINYRRFFDINDLAGIRVERGDVFQATHKLILRLMAERKVTGLRVDHPDGLFDPHGYLRELQEEASRRPVRARSTSSSRRSSPAKSRCPTAGRWRARSATSSSTGSTGSSWRRRTRTAMTADLSGLRRAPTRLRAARLREEEADPAGGAGERAERSRLPAEPDLREESPLPGFHPRKPHGRAARDDRLLPGLSDLHRRASAAASRRRTSEQIESRDPDARSGGTARPARRSSSSSAASCCSSGRTISDDEAREEHARFVMKFQQLTGPVMAKGVEDTSFYIYNRLISLNEVGGEPDRFGLEPEELHGWLTSERSAYWPLRDEQLHHARHEEQRGCSRADQRAFGDARPNGRSGCGGGRS